MSQKNLFTKSALAVAVAIVSSQAYSAGFQLNEFSSSGLGRAYSGEGAVADNAGSASRNPATIMMFDRPMFSGGAVFVDPDVNISGRSPSGRSTNADNIAPTAWVPNLHFVAPINEQFGWGASVTSNYGLATEFNNDYTAGSVAGKTDLETLNLNLSGAYRLNNNWSFGLGFDAVYAKAKIERYAGDLPQLIAGSGKLPPQLAGPVSQIPADTQIAHLKGDEWGFSAGTPVSCMKWIKTTATASPTAQKSKSTSTATIRAACRPPITRCCPVMACRPAPMGKPFRVL